MMMGGETKIPERRIEDVPVVRDFSEEFPEDLLGLLPTRQVEFHIKLIPGAAPVAHVPYRLAPAEIKELAEQLKELSDKDPTKIEVVKSWASPTTPSEIRQFLEAFQLLKQKLCVAPILALPEGSDDFMVYCDASIKGLGAVLISGDTFYMAQNVRCSRDQKRSTHTSYTKKEPQICNRRWIELLSDYDCEIRYHPRKANVVADALRRKERIKPLRVRALVMTIGLDLPSQIREAQKEAVKVENIEAEDIDGMLKKLKPA
ncbi:putative reverse transcriptase domain-containing protein [Tanacetum coccineum]|uniref:Reverse transcriptase domain-containing protein n=1 Tax=Tanacetum coccineum TaxID=301880 RepID=A0ABQ5CSL7_9ASTR